MGKGRNHHVEVGRVVLLNYGPNAGKIATIIDILDSSRALIDGPTTGVKRQSIPLTNLSLTPIKFDVPRSVGSTVLSKAFNAAKVDEQFRKTTWAKKLAKQALRSNLTDFDRFKLMTLRKKKSLIINTEVAKLRRSKLPKQQPKKPKAPLKRLPRPTDKDKERVAEKPKDQIRKQVEFKEEVSAKKSAGGAEPKKKGK